MVQIQFSSLKKLVIIFFEINFKPIITLYYKIIQCLDLCYVCAFELQDQNRFLLIDKSFTVIDFPCLHRQMAVYLVVFFLALFFVVLFDRIKVIPPTFSLCSCLSKTQQHIIYCKAAFIMYPTGGGGAEDFRGGSQIFRAKKGGI